MPQLGILTVRIQQICFPLIVLCAALGGARPASGQNAIGNGGFETPSIFPATSATYNAGSFAIAPWRIALGSIDVVSTLWPAFEGNNSVNVSADGVLRQTFPAFPGAGFKLSFVYANIPNQLFSSGGVAVYGLGGNPVLSESISHSGSTVNDMNWTLFEGYFPGNAFDMSLDFLDTSPDGLSGIVLDAVAITVGSAPGDFTEDGLIDAADYQILSQHLHVGVSHLTLEETILFGDLSQDLRVDGRDFAAFRTIYDEVNGVGAFAAMLNSVPEPTSGLLAAIVGASMLAIPFLKRDRKSAFAA